MLHTNLWYACVTAVLSPPWRHGTLSVRRPHLQLIVIWRKKNSKTWATLQLNFDILDLSVCPFVCLCPSVCLSFWLFACLPACLFVCLSVYLPVFPYVVCLSTRLHGSQSGRLSVSLSAWLSRILFCKLLKFRDVHKFCLSFSPSVSLLSICLLACLPACLSLCL